MEQPQQIPVTLLSIRQASNFELFLSCGTINPTESQLGNVEKSRQRRSRPFAVLTYYEYAPLVQMAAALLDELF